MIESKTAYPYITEFKKEPFKSFVLKKRREIGSYYFSEYEKVRELYHKVEEGLLRDETLNLEMIYWFLLLRKYLQEDKNPKKEEFFKFIKKCEIHQNDQLGFKSTPNSKNFPDIWSTYFALSCLKLLGSLKEYFFLTGQKQTREDIKNFILAHRKGNKFLHCLDKECNLDKKNISAKTTYYIMEIFTILGIDVRARKEQFLSYIGDRKKDNLLVFKLICLKFLDLDSEVKDKEIQYLYQFQNEDGGFSFEEVSDIDITFWFEYTLESYSWLFDYNPSKVYSFINLKLKEILRNRTTWSLIDLTNLSKLIILLSLIWNKFIDNIEKYIFKILEKEKFIDLTEITDKFSISSAIEEIISYINLNFNFKLKISENKIEFNNYIQTLSQGKKTIAREIYEQLSKNEVISLKRIYKRYKSKYHIEPLKLKDQIFPLVKEMVQHNFFSGRIIKKKFYLDLYLDKIITCDIDINLAQLLYEKEKLKDIKNDIYNMTLKLKNISSQIKDEIESYLILDEIEYAKERLKFIIRNALMDADFLNENIENSFNEDFDYLNVQTILKPEISEWNKLYTVLQKRLGEIDSYLKEKILEKEYLRDISSLLEKLKVKIFNVKEGMSKNFDDFRTFFRETFEKGYNRERFDLIILELEKISERMRNYDKIVYSVSQQITTNDRDILTRHKEIIDDWLSFKENFESDLDYYTSGIEYFNSNVKKIELIKDEIEKSLSEISQNAKNKIDENLFQETFDFIKQESDTLLNEKLKEINRTRTEIKKEVNQKQRLILLYNYLLDNLDYLEEYIINLIAEKTQFLKNKITIERNRSQLEDFDNLISKGINTFKAKLNAYKLQLDQSPNLKINDVLKGIENFQNELQSFNNSYEKIFNKCKKSIEDFEAKSKVTIMHWQKFNEFLNNDLTGLKEKYVSDIISKRVIFFANEKKSNYVKLSDLKKDLNLSCKILVNKIRDMIDISKINGKLDEHDKILLVYTEDFYLNKELRNYVDNQLLKLNRERIGKILALYDSSIRKSTLSVNILELQNRINDLKIFEDILPNQFYNKASELKINQEREEFFETKNYFESVMENDRSAMKRIKKNLNLFNEMINFIDQEYNNLKIELMQNFAKIIKDTENIDSYGKIQEIFDNKKESFEEKLKITQKNIEETINNFSRKTNDSNKLIPEIRELFVKKKNNFLKEYTDKIEKINNQIVIMKNEALRGKLMDHINMYKMQLSKLLGTLEKKVEDNIEIKEFKKINLIIQKRAKIIEIEIKEINKNVNKIIKEFSRKSKEFEKTSRYILEDFNNFINEYSEILNEKVKSLERLILKSYINMTIKAVANGFLTTGFLSNELKIKKQNIQDHILFLISMGQLEGKFDIQFQIYYENPEILNDLDINELEVIKSTNFRFYLFLRHLKTFTSQYGSVIAFFASILTITWYLFLFTGGNIATIIVPIILTIIIITYYIFKKKKEEATKKY